MYNARAQTKGPDSVTESSDNYRLRLLVVLAVALIAVVLLAAGLSNVELQTGGIIFQDGPSVSIEEEGVTRDATIAPPNRAYGLLTLAALLVVAYFIVKSRRFRLVALVLGLFTASLLGLVYLYNQYGQPLQSDSAEEVDVSLAQRVPEAAPAAPPGWLENYSILVTLAIVGVAALAAWLVWRRLRRQPRDSLAILASEAESTLAEIRSGANLRDAVLRCYFDMHQALRQRYGYVRADGMTPREFEGLLRKSGLPLASVQRLTRLFERVRYGGQAASSDDQAEAIACLEEIRVAAAPAAAASPTAAHHSLG
jgi:preprotein translocase subunit SecG